MAAQIPFSIAQNLQQFLLGIVAEEAANTKDKDKAVKEIESRIKRIQNDIRDVYDRFIPNVFVVDADVLTNIIVNRLLQNPEKFIDSFSSFKLSEDFGSTTSPEYKLLHTRVVRLINIYHSGLLRTQKSNNPVKDLADLSNRLFLRTRKIENAVSARLLGTAFSKNIQEIFGNKAVMAAVIPELGSSSTRFIFFSRSFTSIGDGFREKVYKPLIEFLRKRVLGGYLESRSDIKIGDIVNIGHAALVNDIGYYVNSPAFAKSLFIVAKGGSQKFAPTEIRESAEFFKKESRVIENSITVSKEFTSSQSGYGVLLALGVTFTNFEDAVINSQRGSKYEGPTARSIGDIKAAKFTNTQLRNLTNRLLRSIGTFNRLAQGRSGKNLVEFLGEAVADTLRGTTTKSVKYETKVSSKITKTVYLPKSQKSVKVPQLSSININAVELKPANRREQYSLTSLQAFLDANLVERVKQNMGSGNRRDILNLRTGRFAESVRVERLSQSRQGMITAFYTYMRNPYATFSAGGRQELPRSRDPKLLISKSIRQVLGEQVSNRLRAVLI